MPVPNTPSLFWNLVIDPAIQQDATYFWCAQDRTYLDSQIRATETLALKAYNLAVTGGVFATPSVTITTSGVALIFTGPENWFNLDVSGGSFIQPIPGILVDGQMVGFRDLTVTKGTAWATHQAAVSVSGGMKIFNPATNTYVTGTLNFPMFAGASYRFQYVASLNLLAPA